MTKLSVNINKVATLRNARGGNDPNVITFAQDCERFGADGITVHPRPDERHIRYRDVLLLKPMLKTEFNIEGNPKEKKFIQLVIDAKPTQVTLVPDVIGQVTSNHGWDTVVNAAYLKETILAFKEAGIRTSIFIDANLEMIEGAKDCGADRVELYTESYAHHYFKEPERAIRPFIEAAKMATEIGLGINAGHDLNKENLAFFAKKIPELLEVSIGHALISDALYLGIENTIQLYLRQLKQ